MWGDFRLMDKSVVEAIGHLGERGRMMKALMSWVGFSRAYVGYHRQARAAGQTTFNASRLVRLALNGVLSFSTAPLRAILVLGLGLGGAAFVYGTFIALRTRMFYVGVPGYATPPGLLVFAGGLQPARPSVGGGTPVTDRTTPRVGA